MINVCYRVNIFAFEFVFKIVSLSKIASIPFKNNFLRNGRAQRGNCFNIQLTFLNKFLRNKRAQLGKCFNTSLIFLHKFLRNRRAQRGKVFNISRIFPNISLSNESLCRENRFSAARQTLCRENHISAARQSLCRENRISGKTVNERVFLTENSLFHQDRPHGPVSSLKIDQ